MYKRSQPTRRRAIASLAAAPWLLHGAARAQVAWPSKTIRYVVTFAAGGFASNFARVLAEPLGKGLGQSVYIDNRAGAGGLIGVDNVSKSPADGYSIVMTAANTTAIAPAIMGSKMPYEPLRDLTPIVYLINQPNVLVAHPSVPTGKFADLVAWAKSRPGEGFATPGTATSNHIMGEMLSSNLGMQLTHVPYKGAAPLTTDLLAGAVNLAVLNIMDAAPWVADGRIKPVLVSTAQRSALLPNVPTMQELGASAFPMISWQGIFGPAGLSASIVSRLNASFNDALKTGPVQGWMHANGATPVGGTPDDFRKFVESEQRLWGDLVRKFKITNT